MSRIRRFDHIGITTTFELTPTEWAALAPQVEATDGITVATTGNGRFFRAETAARGACDPTTGACTT